MRHTISTEDFKDYSSDVILASSSGKRLLINVSPYQQPELVYRVRERVEGRVAYVLHTFSDFESAVAKYNEL